MRHIYSLILYLLTPFILLRLWYKGRRLPAYRGRIKERFCLGNRQQQPVDVWVHAVSLGEVIAASPLIEAMLAKGWSILITTMTPTGSEHVQKRFGLKVAHQYVPYDLPGVLKRFFRQLQPKVGVLMETELWPNLIYQAHAAKVPLLLANARLSEKSFKSYRKLKWFFKPMLQRLTAILAQTKEDAQRFMLLGADEKQVRVFGNMKFDLITNDVPVETFNQLKQSWGQNRVVLIAASTHDDEEAQILSQWRRVQTAIPNALLLLAPRHPERFQTVYQLANNAGFNTGLRSQKESITPECELIVLDSLGELLGFYKIADYAFVGGSLVSIGGHNVLEPIAMGIPVFSGDKVHNFKSICRDLQAASAICIVSDVQALIDAVIRVHQDKKLQKQMLENAAQVLERNRGAVGTHLQVIESLIAYSAIKDTLDLKCPDSVVL